MMLFKKIKKCYLLKEKYVNSKHLFIRVSLRPAYIKYNSNRWVMDWMAVNTSMVIEEP